MNRLLAFLLAFNMAFANLVVIFHLPLSSGSTQSFEDMNEATSVFHSIYTDSSRSTTDRLIALHTLADIGVNHYDEITAANLNIIESDSNNFFNSPSYLQLALPFLYDSGIITSNNSSVGSEIFNAGVARMRSTLNLTTWRETVLAFYDVSSSGITRTEHTAPFVRESAQDRKPYIISSTLAFPNIVDNIPLIKNNSSLYREVINYVNNFENKDEYLFGVFQKDFYLPEKSASSFDSHWNTLSSYIGNPNYDSSKTYGSISIIAIKLSDFYIWGTGESVSFLDSNWIDYINSTPHIGGNYPYNFVKSFVYFRQSTPGAYVYGYQGAFDLPLNEFLFWDYTPGQNYWFHFYTPSGSISYTYPFYFTTSGRAVVRFRSRNDAIDYDLGRQSFYFTSYVPESNLNNIPELIQNTENNYTYITNNSVGMDPNTLQQLIDSITNVGEEVEETTSQLKSIKHVLEAWFAAWIIRGPAGEDPSGDNDVSLKDLLIPLFYVIMMIFVLIKALGLVVALGDYLMHIFNIPATFYGLHTDFVNAIKFLKGTLPETDDFKNFYLLTIGDYHMSCMDFMIIIFELAFIGMAVSLIRKYTEKISIPEVR